MFVPAVAQVIGNTGSNSTGEALHATEQGFAVGMHAALQINPYYGKTSKLGLKAHFDAVLKEGPAIVYNVPSRTGQDIPDDIVQGMALHPNFLGMKECTGNERIGKYAKQVSLCCSAHQERWVACTSDDDVTGPQFQATRQDVVRGSHCVD